MVVNQSELSTHQPHSQGLSHLLDLEEGDRGGSGGDPRLMRVIRHIVYTYTNESKYRSRVGHDY